MDAGRGLNRYFDALGGARAPLRDPGVWVPFALFALLQALILLAMAMFTTPWLAPVMVPVLRSLGGDASLHYPLHLVGLPAVYQRLYLPLVASVGFSLWTLAVWKLVDHHTYGAERRARAFRPLLLHTVSVGVLFVATSVLVSWAAASVVGPRTPAMVGRAVMLVSIVLVATLQTFLVYAPVALRLRGGNAWGALRTSARYARRNFLATALLIVTVLLVHMPVDFLLARADRVAARFSPETVLELMLVSVLLEMFTAYILFAGVTELALPREGGMSS
jgi:hypothetical protein